LLADSWTYVAACVLALAADWRPLVIPESESCNPPVEIAYQGMSDLWSTGLAKGFLVAISNRENQI